MAYKGAILVVSFGSSVEAARDNAIFPIEELIRNTFTDYYVARAFTSNKVIKKMKDTQNIQVDTPEEGIKRLIEQGFKQIILQPLHIIAGYEFDKIKDTIKQFITSEIEIKLGKPLLYYDIDYLKVIEGLKSQITAMKNGEVILLIGHGTQHPANACYDELQLYINSQNLPIIVCTIEQGIEPILRKLNNSLYKEVQLMPFLLVAGEHVLNDILGDEEESWKCRLISNGYEVRAYQKGLGENPVFRQLYLDRVSQLITKSTKANEEDINEISIY